MLPWLFCCRVNLPSKKCHLWILGITPWLAPKSPINSGNPFGRKDNRKYQHCQYQLKVSNGCFCHPYSAEGFCISWGVTGNRQLWSFAQLFDLESHSASDLCFDKLLLFQSTNWMRRRSTAQAHLLKTVLLDFCTVPVPSVHRHSHFDDCSLFFVNINKLLR